MFILVCTFSMAVWLTHVIVSSWWFLPEDPEALGSHTWESDRTSTPGPAAKYGSRQIKTEGVRPALVLRVTHPLMERMGTMFQGRCQKNPTGSNRNAN